MPYRWETPPDRDGHGEMHLWPHQSLTPDGFSNFMLGFFALAVIPFFGLLGTSLLWALLPFMLAAVGGIWFAIRRNNRDRQILEILTLTPDALTLRRHNPKGPPQDWEENPYWVRVTLHRDGGPVPFYVTLSGRGREVEIGAFLSEDERKALHAELSDRLAQLAQG